jgi:hypothetical protein
LLLLLLASLPFVAPLFCEEEAASLLLLPPLLRCDGAGTKSKGIHFSLRALFGFLDPLASVGVVGVLASLSLPVASPSAGKCMESLMSTDLLNFLRFPDAVFFFVSPSADSAFVLSVAADGVDVDAVLASTSVFVSVVAPVTGALLLSVAASVAVVACATASAVVAACAALLGVGDAFISSLLLLLLADASDKLAVVAVVSSASAFLAPHALFTGASAST